MGIDVLEVSRKGKITGRRSLRRALRYDDRNCRDIEPDLMFPEVAADENYVTRVCKGCPILWECLGDALDADNENGQHGVAGGYTARQRRVWLKDRPHVNSWLISILRWRQQVEYEESLANAS